MTFLAHNLDFGCLIGNAAQLRITVLQDTDVKSRKSHTRIQEYSGTQVDFTSVLQMFELLMRECAMSLYLVCMTCVLVCTCPNVRERVHHKRYTKKATKAWHARLPADSSSKITSWLPQIEPRAAAHSNPHLIAKLPVELRRIIYRELIDGEDVLVQVPSENKFWYQDEIGKEETPFKILCPKARSLLRLAASCRIAYVDISFNAKI